MRTLVVSSPHFSGYSLVREALDAHPEITTVIPVLRSGAGAMALRWAKDRRVTIELLQLPGESRAGRLVRLVDYADQTLAVWDGSDARTRYLIRQMQQRGKNTYFVSPARMNWAFGGRR